MINGGWSDRWTASVPYRYPGRQDDRRGSHSGRMVRQTDRVAGRYQDMVGGQTEYQTYIQADRVIGGYPDRLNDQVNREEG